MLVKTCNPSIPEVWAGGSKIQWDFQNQNLKVHRDFKDNLVYIILCLKRHRDYGDGPMDKIVPV